MHVRPTRWFEGSRQKGLALIAVLWIVAALSLVVTGVVQNVRQELRIATASRDSLQGEAVGRSAIQLVLQRLAASSQKPQRLTFVDTLYKDVSVRVRVLPLTGLIDINRASPALLTQLFVHVAQVQPQAAAALADSVVAARSTKDRTGRAIGFESAEDLMEIQGFGYAIYDKVAPLITADGHGSGRVNPMAALPEILVVLSAGDLVRAALLQVGEPTGKPA